MHSIMTTIVTFAFLAVTIHGMVIALFKHSSLLNTDKSINIDAIDPHISSIRAKIHPDFDNYEEKRGIVQSILSGSPDSGPHVALRTDKSIAFSWYCTMSIGTDPKSFSVVIDTGSSDTFVPASTCGVTCKGHKLWDPTSSSTAKELEEDSEFNIQFAKGDIVSGKIYTDNLTIDGFTADIQAIGVATTYSSTFHKSRFVADGLLGLAFPSLSDFHSTKPFLTTLFNEGKLPNRMFSVQLTPNGGELYIGGFNTDLYDGEITFTPVTQPGYWWVDMENIQGNGKIALSGPISAIIDTGSNFIFGDMARVEKLHAALGGKHFEDGYFTFKCNSIPEVSLTFHGRSFSIAPDVLNQGQVEYGSSDCFSGILGLEENLPYWEVGGIFLQGVYTVFDFGDNPQVGFAEHA